MTFDPMQHGGRTQRQVDANEQANEICAIGIAALFCSAALYWAAAWITYLVATVAGWM